VPVPVQSPPRVCFRNFEWDLTSGELHKDGPESLSLPQSLRGAPLFGRTSRRSRHARRLARSLMGGRHVRRVRRQPEHAVKKLREALEDRADERATSKLCRSMATGSSLTWQS